MKLLKTAQKGFTLIELLIVIALLGALALGLIATIDPFEQLKKGRDTSQRNVSAETYNAFLRYYSTKGKFTWATSSAFGGVALGSMGTDITELINAGELKARFMELAGTDNVNKIYVTSSAADHIAVCFKPESKAFQKDNNTIYNDGGTSVTGCKSQTSGTGGSDCHYCFQ